MKSNKTYIVLYSVLLLMSSYVDAMISTIALILPIIFISSLVLNSGKTIPIRELILSTLAVQCILMPYLYYNHLEMPDVYEMAVSDMKYFQFMVPSFCALALGLYLFSIPTTLSLKSSRIEQIQKIGKTLIYIGFAGELMTSFVPGGLAFFVVLLSYFKYIGAVYILFTQSKNKYIWIFIAYLPLIAKALIQGMFHELLGWSIFFTIFYFYREKTKLTLRIAVFGSAIVGVYVLQNIKSEYREVVWNEEEMSVAEKSEVFAENYSSSINDEATYNDENINENLIRFNQGYIISRVMEYVPYYEPYADGSTIASAFYGALVPRFLDPSKTKVGADGGMYSRFTGYELHGGTSMDIGIMGEIYANFGPKGGVVFSFFLGLLYSFILFMFFRNVKADPQILFWLPFLFLIAIRPENSFVPVFNHLFKASIVLYMAYKLYLSKYQKLLRLRLNY